MRHSRLLISALATALLPLAPAVHAAGSVLVGPANGLKFNLTPDTSFDTTSATGAAAFQDFQTAALRWSSLFSDNITVNLTVGLVNLGGSNVIGQTGSSQFNYSYNTVRTALTTDARSADDLTAVANLPVGTTSPELINRTSNNGNSPTAFRFDNGNVTMTTANAKALGLSSYTGNDATIDFNSNFAFDYNEADGVDSNKIDFLFVATHEIGHSLGFISSVDSLDYFSPGMAASTYYKTPLDLFRYSAASYAAGAGVTDFTTGKSLKYFSLDGGKTMISSNAYFATGVTYGDGSQASHWQDNLGTGIMDPSASYGETGFITQNDIRAFDAIGYNLAAPEPSQYAALGLGLLGLGGLILKARRRNTVA